MRPTDAQILEAVADGFQDTVELTKALTRIPSQRGAEGPAHDLYARELRARGYHTEMFPIELDLIRDHPGFSPVTVDYNNVFNVVGTHRPRKETGRSLILNGHVDVVPTGPVEGWSASPYSAHVEGDWLYGRGSGDMKAGLAANLAALDALRRLGLQPAATVHIQCVSEEECTGNGALACVAKGYRADAAIIPEPQDETLTRANTGAIWFRVHVEGEAVHARTAGTGSNAIETMYDVIQALRGLEAAWNERRHTVPHFEALDHPINLNIGKIEGGDWASSVPAWCVADCRIALFPGMNAREAAKEVEQAVAEAARAHPVLANRPPRVEFNGFMAEGYVLEEGSNAERTLAKAHLTAHHAPLRAEVSRGYLDGRVFVLYQGTPCLVYGPVAENIHGFNERVNLPSLQRVTGTIALFIADWCGVEPINP
ncbi:MAG: ArgE/DapE family deacylase [Pseudomonadota bacterium]